MTTRRLVASVLFYNLFMTFVDLLKNWKGPNPRPDPRPQRGVTAFIEEVPDEEEGVDPDTDVGLDGGIQDEPPTGTDPGGNTPTSDAGGPPGAQGGSSGSDDDDIADEPPTPRPGAQAPFVAPRASGDHSGRNIGGAPPATQESGVPGQAHPPPPQAPELAKQPPAVPPPTLAPSQKQPGIPPPTLAPPPEQRRPSRHPPKSNVDSNSSSTGRSGGGSRK